MQLRNLRAVVAVLGMLALIAACAVPAMARGGDGTGPDGRGELTGRGAGYCAGFDVPGYRNTAVAPRGVRGAAFGGRGRGFRNVFNATGLTRWQRQSSANSAQAVPQKTVQTSAQTKEQRVEAMKARVKALADELETLLGEIKKLEAEK